MKKKFRILQTSDVVHAGGAETFLLRLADGLQQKDHEIFVYILYKNRIDYKLIDALCPQIRVYPARLRFIRLLQLIDGLLLRLNIDFSLVNFLLIRDLKHFIKKHNIDLIHSHLFTTDYIAVKAAAQKLPVVTTMHGDYMLYDKKIQQNIRLRIINYGSKAKMLLQTLKAIVCISEEQLAFFEEKKGQTGFLPVYKIYNGYKPAPLKAKITRAGLAIPEGAFVYGMVARGIAEKGWELVIQSFIGLAMADTYLLLIGHSDYVEGLRQRYSGHRRIIFAGYSSNPIEYIPLFNAGLFASTYYAESLPTVVMEYLFCGVPVVCCDIAECGRMLEAGAGKTAGLLIQRAVDGSVPVARFSKGMRQIYADKTLYEKLSQNTAEAFQKFDMDHCVAEYEQLYSGILLNKLFAEQ